MPISSRSVAKTRLVRRVLAIWELFELDANGPITANAARLRSTSSCGLRESVIAGRDLELEAALKAVR